MYQLFWFWIHKKSKIKAVFTLGKKIFIWSLCLIRRTKVTYSISCSYVLYENLYELLQNPACLKQSTATWTRRWHYTADAVKIFCQNISTAKGVRSLNCNPRLTLFNSFLMWFYKPHQNNNYPGNETHVQKWLVYSKFKSCLSLTLIKSAEFDDHNK